MTLYVNMAVKEKVVSSESKGAICCSTICKGLEITTKQSGVNRAEMSHTVVKQWDTLRMGYAIQKVHFHFSPKMHSMLSFKYF